MRLSPVIGLHAGYIPVLFPSGKLAPQLRRLAQGRGLVAAICSRASSSATCHYAPEPFNMIPIAESEVAVPTQMIAIGEADDATFRRNLDEDFPYASFRHEKSSILFSAMAGWTRSRRSFFSTNQRCIALSVEPRPPNPSRDAEAEAMKDPSGWEFRFSNFCFPQLFQSISIH